MSLSDWSKRNDTGVWSQRQPLQPPPRFQHAAVAAAWERMEHIAVHQLRRGVSVPSRVRWFRLIDEGWRDPTGLLAIATPRREEGPVDRFLLMFAEEPAAHLTELEASYGCRLEVFQEWPGSVGLAHSLKRGCAHLESPERWYRWSDDEVGELSVALDLVAQAWAHRRYWFGLEG